MAVTRSRYLRLQGKRYGSAARIITFAALTERYRSAPIASHAALRGACSRLALSVSCGMLLPLLGLIATSAQAADLYWDINGATAGAGGTAPSGTWSAGGTTLSTSATGSAGTGAVTTTTADRLFFSAGTDATGSYTVTVNGTQNIGRLTFQEGRVNLTGGTIDFGAVAGIIDGDATGDTISSVIAGTGGLTLNGGTITLNGVNTFTGQMQFTGTAGSSFSFNSIADSGTASALGAGSTIVVNSSGVLILNYTGSGHSSNRNWSVQTTPGADFRLRNNGTGTLTLTGNITMESDTDDAFYEANGGNLELLGVISGGSAPSATSFSSNSGRTITLGGANTYSGITSISGATVVVSVLANGGAGNPSSFGTGQGSTAGISISSNGRVSYTGDGDSSNRPWTFNNGTLSNDGSGALTLSGNVNLFAGTGTLGGSFTGAANTMSGVISGGGALSVNTAGTWALTNANTYTGGTTITAGTLQLGNGGTTGSILGNVVDNGVLAFNRSDAVTFGGVISGSGQVQQLGAGTTILASDNTYTGGTTISAGTLQLGSGGTSGSIVGDVVNNGTLAFNRSDTSTLSGAISGSGGVSQIGSGTTILAGNNTYTGGTTISAGTLQLGDGGTSGSIVGNVVNNGVLAFNRSDTFTFGGAISGTGAVNQIGSGTTILTGDSSSFTGATVIAQGTLVVNGSLAGSAVTVASGARLGGSGTIGATTLASGGRITPGNSIGTLTVSGSYSQASGASYQVELDPGTVTSDRIQVTGTATLASGATLSVVNYTGAGYVAGQRYTILTSTGLTGSYGSDDYAVSLFLSLRNSTDATNAYLTVVQTRTVASVGGTGNEVAVGTAIDSLPAGNTVQTEVANATTLEAARGALGQLAGEIHGSAKTALIDESWLLRAAVNDRLRSAFGAVGAAPMATMHYGFTADLAPVVKGLMPKLLSAERFAVWGQAYGSWGRIDGNGNAAKLTRSTGGLVVGADVAAFDNLRFGVIAGYSRSTFDVNARLSSGESDNYHLGLYGGGQFGALSLRAGASYTWHDVETRRTVVASALGSRLRADYDAGTAQVFGEAGYRVELGQTALGKVALEPFAGLAYVVLRSDGFSETGGAAALTGSSDDTSLGYATLGLRAATTARLSGMDFSLRGGLAWRHAFGDVDPKTVLAFAGSNSFAIAGVPIARNAALVEAGLDIAISANATLGVSYAGQLASDAQDHAFKANLAVRF